jgi:UDP-glucose 4-epimerase
MNDKTRILVTGGAGFVGSNLCERLVQDKNNHVISLDNYFTGSRENHIPDVTYIEDSTENIMEYLTFQPHYIYHLGEYSRVEQSFHDFNLVWKFNKLGTHKVLEYANILRSKLIYAGSSTKYVEETEGYVQSPYAWSKASNTEYVKRFCEWNGLDYVITYFYNVYGNREISTGKYATLIAKFIEASKKGESLTVVSPGTQLRNFTHIDDIVDGLILVGKKGHGDEYGIGNETSYSILEVAKLFKRDIIMLDPRQGNRMSAKVVTDKTKALGWSTKRNLEDWIKTNVE